MKKIFGLLFSILLVGCNDGYQKELNKIRNSGYLINEDITDSLLGMDKNHNNIRDDVENYIKRKYEYDFKYMKSLLKLASDLNNQFKEISDDAEQHHQNAQNISDDFECIRKIEKESGIIYEDRAYIDIVALYANTTLRREHLHNIESILNGHTFKSNKCN